MRAAAAVLLGFMLLEALRKLEGVPSHALARAKERLSR